MCGGLRAGAKLVASLFLLALQFSILRARSLCEARMIRKFT